MHEWVFCAITSRFNPNTCLKTCLTVAETYVQFTAQIQIPQNLIEIILEKIVKAGQFLASVKVKKIPTVFQLFAAR